MLLAWTGNSSLTVSQAFLHAKSGNSVCRELGKHGRARAGAVFTVHCPYPHPMGTWSPLLPSLPLAPPTPPTIHRLVT